MTTIIKGTPCWYELGTSDLDAADTFYRNVLGWSIGDAGMPGFTYHLATASDGVMVAGMMSNVGQQGDPPPNWVVYFSTDNCDETASSIREAGGSVLMEPADIPGTGRFSIVADPQGAVFGLLQPLPMEDGSQSGRAFDQQASGHGNWHELMTNDPGEAFGFYTEHFGWTKGEAMDMGDMGVYQIFHHNGADIGAMMSLGNAPTPAWLPYFGANGIDEAVERIKAGHGTIHKGPMEVPGGAHVAIARDPQGAWFAVVGPRTSL